MLCFLCLELCDINGNVTLQVNSGIRRQPFLGQQLKSSNQMATPGVSTTTVPLSSAMTTISTAVQTTPTRTPFRGSHGSNLNTSSNSRANSPVKHVHLVSLYNLKGLDLFFLGFFKALNMG